MFPFSIHTSPRQARPQVKRWLPSYSFTLVNTMWDRCHRAEPRAFCQATGGSYTYCYDLWVKAFPSVKVDVIIGHKCWIATCQFQWSALVISQTKRQDFLSRSLAWVSTVVRDISKGGFGPMNFIFLSLLFAFWIATREFRCMWPSDFFFSLSLSENFSRQWTHVSSRVVVCQ